MKGPYRIDSTVPPLVQNNYLDKRRLIEKNATASGGKMRIRMHSINTESLDTEKVFNYMYGPEKHDSNSIT